MEISTKEELIESLGIHFESLYQMPPLATRMYAMLILNGSEGQTFEELMQATRASKSSVSTSLNLLVRTHKIEYFTKPGSRKRYFKRNANHLKDRMSNHSQQINRELKLFETTCNYMKHHCEASYKKNEKFTTIYKGYLQHMKHLMDTTIHKLEAIS